ncbi:MAG TPA: hypothetical protein PKV17_11465 [Aquabacterium sp.]|jgi:L-2-hydroxyglutarate oxidase LhgO|nr:hypothetical protein [Aquabacterium sp.]HRH29387.1 hypothetical protein [Aquabacterium sp.]
MNLARILLTAAALTLQAMALSLISPGLSQAGQVYRCGGSSYQMQPCAPTQATTVVKADDARHREQLKQAASQRAQLLKADQQINRRIAKFLKRPPKSVAATLGEPPQWDLPSTKEGKGKRGANKPFTARVPATPDTSVAMVRP